MHLVYTNECSRASEKTCPLPSNDRIREIMSPLATGFRKVEVHVVSAIGLDTEFADAADARRTKGPFIATQPNSTQLTQLNSVQPISEKQVSRVFVYDVMTYKLSQLGHYVH